MKGPNNSQSLVDMPLSEELPKSLIYLIKYYPIYLAAWGLSCDTQYPQSLLQHVRFFFFLLSFSI